MTLNAVKMTLCHFDIVKALFNTKNLILVSFNTKKYIKSREFLQVIIYKVTVLKEMILRNLVQASFNSKMEKS